MSSSDSAADATTAHDAGAGDMFGSSSTNGVDGSEAVNAGRRPPSPSATLLPPLVLDDDPARPRAMSWETYLAWLEVNWPATLNTAQLEKDVQHFLELHPCLLPGGASNDGLGHHGAWYDAVITQPALVTSRTKRIPDFMWLRRDTVANRPVCIEIERSTKQWYLRDGQPTAELTQALDQIDDWRTWFDTGTNRQQFADAYVPPERRYRDIEPRFILIYGRDSEFRVGTSKHRDPDFMRKKRDSLRRDDVEVITFDMLRANFDLKDRVCLSGTLPTFDVEAIPPTFGTSPHTDEELVLHAPDPVPALDQNTQLSPERRAYVAMRWEYWRKQAIAPARFRQGTLATE